MLRLSGPYRFLHTHPYASPVRDPRGHIRYVIDPVIHILFALFSDVLSYFLDVHAAMSDS